MAQLVRTYDNPKAASAVVSQLKAANFNNIEQVSDGNGGSVVVVEPPFGQGSKAEAILNSQPGIKTNGANGAAHTTRSNGFGGASLISSSTHLSGSPRLTDSRTTSEWLGLPTLVSSDAFFSGFPLLIKSKPFSSLSKNQNGSAKLIDEPAPFSKALGLPVLL